MPFQDGELGVLVVDEENLEVRHVIPMARRGSPRWGRTGWRALKY
jgi:hypothetical protein